MKKRVTIRKNNLVNGAMITTLGIIITKIIGVFYVIPFHSLIGEDGGALYGYAYTVYLFFMSLASAGIPLAISKIVSEYQTLGYLQIKNRVFLLGKRIAMALGVLCFMVIVFLAPLIAKLVLGNVYGGNTIEDIVFVIRIIAIAVLVTPLLSVYRGYFEGHRFMRASAISQVIEQIVRVSIIVLGSYIGIKVFNFKVAKVVGMALFSATVGAFISYLYLVKKKASNKSKFQSNGRKINEPLISDKVIIKKIFYYALPFVVIDLFKFIYNYIDMTSVVKNLVLVAQFNVKDAEAIYGMLSTWAAKFNMVILSISTGVIVSLVPNLSNGVTKKDKKGINKIICRSLELLLLFMVPITLGISFLAKPIWILFYGQNVYGPNLLSYNIFVGLFLGLFTVGMTMLQALNEYRVAFISLLVGVLVKICCNKYLLTVFYQMNFSAYYGIITATILGYLVSFVICLIYLKKKYQVSFEKTIHCFVDVLCGSSFMVIMMFLLKIFIPTYLNARFLNVFIILFYSAFGALVYFLYLYKTRTFKHVFTKSSINGLKYAIFKK